MVAALAAGAAEKFVIALPNGYEMSRERSGAAVISKRRGKVVVPGPIKAYTVVREVVVGQLDVPEPKGAKAEDSSAAAGADGGRPGAGGAPPGGGGKPAPAADKPPANPVFARPPPSPNGRYFVLDTKTGEVGKDLFLPEWEERLKKFDITTAPELAEPILPK